MLGTRSCPDWVLLGVPLSDTGQFLVVGSTELTEAELKVEYQQHPPILYDICVDYPPDTLRRFNLSATGKSYAMAWGDTYTEALSRLFGFWSPDGKGLALDAPRSELTT